MRLARRALWLALILLTLCAAATAQTLRSEGDPRNIAPTVGTGGQPGGPTGLFTIYDGQTLRKHEFTFSLAYSNYDRDPGNVDITEVPVSFQLGLNDHIELFFNTDAYRGVKVNTPSQLSSFYLPNSQLFLSIPQISPTGVVTFSPNQLRSGGIVVVTPLGAQARNFPTTIARLPGGPFFVQFPFTGGPAAGFGFDRAAVPVVATLGPASGGSSNFGAAGFFPGIGSPVGSILPGIILTTTTVPATLTTRAQIVPATFTIAPSYLPDAPFINRLYGQSTFSTFTAGAKIALTAPERPLSIAIVPFYRWYADKANEFAGFNMLQRGASPGGNIGDFGISGIVSGRVTKHFNLSANITYIKNSNPKSDAFGGGDVTLLDRPDEFMSGIGFDFPLNRHFQPIFELKSINYVGSRTQNAFPNNPVEFLGGVRIFPKRWWGMSAWYRAHLNQQGKRLFHDFNAGDFPAGFIPSDDPHGFGFQIFAGHRNVRAPIELPNQPPVVSLAANPATVTLAASCPADQMPAEGCTPSSTTVQLAATATDPDGDTLLYTWSTTGGRITGDGPNVTWDLSGATPGTYTATVEVDDGCGCIAYANTSVTVTSCGCVPRPTPPPACPTITVDCPTSLTSATAPITFTANVSGGNPNASLTYNWTVSAGAITSGQGTSSITVDPTGIAGGTGITASVTVGGLDPSCSASASCTAGLPNAARKFDEYGNIKRNDEKARLDNFANELQANPGAQGYIIGYGGRHSRPGEGQARADRAKDYLVNSRGIDAGRLVTVDGGYKEEPTTELWIVPSGATPPTATPTVDASQVQPARVRRAPRRRRGRDDDE
jgi:PKD domain